MNRNRDLNGDGDITPDEIRWYTPTSSRYIQIATAQSDLPDPLMRFTDYSKDYFLKYWNSESDYYKGTANFHYITSDYQYYWAEQAVNTGGQPYAGWFPTATAAYTVRCIRNLGSDPSEIPVKGVREVDYAYTHNSKDRTFTQDNFTDNTLRGYNIGGIAPHDVSSPSARPYKKFEYAKHICTNVKDSYINFNSNGALSFISASNKGQQTASWTNSLRQNGICGQYSQETDRSDLGTWRMPSAYELALMWIEGLLRNTPTMESGYASVSTNQSFYLSATHDYFISNTLMGFSTDNQLYLGYNDEDNRQVLSLDCLNNSGYIRLRCVRDVKM
jgi:hypothetical protein